MAKKSKIEQSLAVVAGLHAAVAGTTSTDIAKQTHHIAKSQGKSTAQTERDNRGNVARNATSDKGNRVRGNHKKK